MRKQLLSTIIFLLLSVLVLGMASYAWVANNARSTAGGMSVSVDMPINIMASLDAPAVVQSVTGFKTNFEFGSTVTDESGTLINVMDVLVPVTSTDGKNLLYLPFRYVDPNGCPRSDVTEAAYILVPNNLNSGYYIDIPMYLVTTTMSDTDVFISSIQITAPSGVDSAISGAVRCAVLLHESGGVRSLITAKDSTAHPLSNGTTTFYPVGYSNGVVFQLQDFASWESSYYLDNPEETNPYQPTPTNRFTLRASERVGEQTNYYTTKIQIRIWVEGTDISAVASNAGAYFAVSLSLAVVNN